MKKATKLGLRILIGVAALCAVAAACVFLYFKAYLPGIAAPASFPKIEGRLKVPGLEASAEVIRDKMGIPHIYATTSHDLFFAQGFVHAQERFWQMDAWRHIGSGTLSEMFGKGQVPTDAFLRTLGWKQVAEEELRQLSPDGRSIAQAYADGVNAWLAGRSGAAASLEYAIVALLSPSYKIQPWTPVNTLTWGKAMAWDLGGNLSEEIERAILGKTLTPAQVGELFPAYPADYPVIVPAIGKAAAKAGASGDAGRDPAIASADSATPLEALRSVAANLSLLSDALGPTGPDIGSNSWAVSGKLTESGKPLLANDMHLGIQMPSIWFENSLHCTTASGVKLFDVTGFSFPGVPGIIAGHNDRIAWGFTNLGPDVQDLFIEKVNPQNGNQYEAFGKWVDFQIRKETIEVAGGKPVEITIRVSRHGPIISDSFGPLMDRTDPKGGKKDLLRDRIGQALPEEYAIAFSWTALSPNSPFETVWKFDRARNWDDFRAAARGWSVPAQNLLYADVEGNIGYQTPGAIPIRKKGDGTVPVPGWSGDYDWKGFIPFEELPWVLNPQSGYIATANNQANPRDYPYLLTKDWDYGQRAARIVEMIKAAPGKIDTAYFQAMHGDAKSFNAADLVPVLLSAKMSPEPASIRDRFFSGWDFQESADSKATTLFESFWARLLDDTFGDDLPTGYSPDGGSRWFVVMRDLVKKPGSPWWDDKRTPVIESRDDILARAFTETVVRLGAKYGKDLARLPAWGELHGATFRNQTLGESGIGLIEGLFNRGPFATGGGKSVVDATGYALGKGFGVNWLPSEREIVDLSDLDASLAIHTTGESGHAYYKHYADMAPLWARVEYAPMWFDEASVIKDAEGRLELVP